TFAKGGYIINIRPAAIGMLVVPTWKLWINPSMPGTKKPRPTPRAMAAKIQTVKYLSRNESFLVMALIDSRPDISPETPRSFHPLLTQLPQLVLQRKPVNARKRQAKEGADAVGDLELRVRKCLQLPGPIADHRSGVGKAPMCRDRLPRPCWTNLAGCSLADGEDEIHLRGTGPGEFLPTLAAQATSVITLIGQHLQRERMDLTARMAARAVGAKSVFPQAVQGDLGHDAARGVTGANEQSVVDLVGHFMSFPSLSPRPRQV